MNTTIRRFVASALLYSSLHLLAPTLDGQIEWRSGAQPPVQMSSQELEQALGELSVSGQNRHCVVQFDASVSLETRAMLKAGGLTLQSYLGNHAFFALLEPERLDVEAVGQASAMQCVVEVDPLWKQDELIAASEIPEYALVAGEGGQSAACYALFHEDVSISEAWEFVNASGGIVRDVLEPLNGLVIELPLAILGEFVLDDRVKWIEPALPAFEGTNDSNRAAVQANLAQASPYNLDGSGVGVLVYDVGTALGTHSDFGTRVHVRDGSGTQEHATHVTGTIGGNGAASGSLYRGMAPNVTVQSYGYQWNGAGIFLYSNPGDMLADYTEAITSYGVNIGSNSISSNPAQNNFPCSIEGNYGVTSMTIDSIVRGSGGRSIPLVWANGNERGPGRCGTSYGTTPPPAGAKNHLTVGAVNSNDLSITSFTSYGPVDDGRLKPDVSGPGCQTNADLGVTSTSSSGGYSTLCGTSMATPTVAGASALLIQDYRAHFPGRPDFVPSTLKALIVQTAQDLSNPGPDYKTGYGEVRIKDAIDFMRLDQFLEASAVDGVTWVGYMSVPSGTSALKVTVAWDDYPGTPNVVPALVNDLDVVAIDPGGVTHYPWTLVPTNPTAFALRTQADHRNNLEQVLVDNPSAGTWRIEVRGYDVPHGPQVFSLATSLPVSQGPVTRYVPSVYPTIQSAIDASVDGDAIVVDQGTYAGPGNRDLDYLGKDITIRSWYGPRSTVIDCENSAIGVIFRTQETENAMLDGFTIRRGNASASQRVATQNGGGIYISNASPKIINCIIEENHAPSSGAGIFVDGYASPSIDRCLIRGNSATLAGSFGGGVAVWGSSQCNVRLSNCMIVGNTAGASGGGIHCGFTASQACSLTIRNSTIAGNIVSSTSGISAGVHYFGVGAQHAAALNDCIVWGNLTGTPGTDQQINVGNGVLAATYSDIAGGPSAVGGSGILTWGIGNLDVDPEFFSPLGPDANAATWQDNDFHVLMFSPVIDAGDPAFMAGPGEYDIDGRTRLSGRVDMGADERNYLAVSEPSPCGAGNVLAVPSAPYPTIESAIAAASDCDIVEVEPGTYTPGSSSGFDFLGKDIIVRGRLGAASTTIDCLNAGRAFVLNHGESRRATIQGFTIENGLAPDGGAISCDGASVTVLACVLRDNTSTYRGGAIHCRFGGLRVDACQIVDNTALFGQGGGVYFAASNDSTAFLEVTNTQILRNTANLTTGGGIDCAGDALLRNCSILLNHATGLGGGVHSGDDALVEYESCIIMLNSSQIGLTNDIAAESGVFATEYCAYWSATPFFISPGNATWLTYGGVIDPGSPGLDFFYHLDSVSPFIDAGLPSYVAGIGETDVHGEARVGNGRVDIGSDEYHDCNGDGNADYLEMFVLNNFCGPKPNGAGPGATISVSGSLSVANNDLLLHVTGALPNKTGLFFFGPNKALPPYPVPDACLLGPIRRLPGITTDAHGEVTFHFNRDSLPVDWRPASGSTYYFQFFFRDLIGGNPSGASYSDAIEVTFCD